MWRRGARLGCCGLALLALACGGKTSGSESDGSDGSEPDPPPGAGDSDVDGDEDFGSQTRLGPCTEGPLLGEAAGDCPYLAEDRCYPTKLEACACVCPKRTGSTCISGFPRDGRSARVSCF